MPPLNRSSYCTFAELPMGSDVETEMEIMRSWDRFEAMRLCRRFLRHLGQRDEKWGFTIYRTVYTPGSDALFISALERIKDCLAICLRYELRHVHEIRALTRPLDPGETRPPLIKSGPCDQVEDLYDPVVVENPEVWDGASIEDVRAHFRDGIFREFLKSGYIPHGSKKDNTVLYKGLAEHPKTSTCIVIDAEALNSIANAEAPERGVYGLREEELLASPVDPKVYMESWPLEWGQHGFVKGVEADWPRRMNIPDDDDDNEPSMLGARKGIPDPPPRRGPHYHGWERMGCDNLWAQYNDEKRNGGRLMY